MIPCMGGFCLSRGRCPNYYAESTHEPVERLCGEIEEPGDMPRPYPQGSRRDMPSSLIEKPSHSESTVLG